MNAVHTYQVWFAAPVRAAEDVAAACASVAGGLTLIPAHGSWVNEAGLVEDEPMALGTASVPDIGTVERLRIAIREQLKSYGERCMWFTSQRISGGLSAVGDAHVDCGQHDGRPESVRVAG